MGEAEDLGPKSDDFRFEGGKFGSTSGVGDLEFEFKAIDLLFENVGEVFCHCFKH